MAVLAGDIVSEISAQLHGWGSTQDRITPLSNDLDTSSLTFVVGAASGQAVGITPGVVEVNSEQMYVTAVDQATGTVTLAPGFGRGYGGTVAATHPAGSIIISRPKFPRLWIFKTLNEVVGSLYPDLFAVKTQTLTVTFPQNTYVIPGVAGKPFWVIDAQWQHPIGDWIRDRSYSIDAYDGTFRLGSGAMIGRPLRLVYATEPTQFVAETDDLVTATGLPLSCADLLQMGVVARLIPGLDISRAQLSSVEQSDRGRVVPPNAGINASKYLMQEYMARLANEKRALRTLYKPKMKVIF